MYKYIIHIILSDKQFLSLSPSQTGKLFAHKHHKNIDQKLAFEAFNNWMKPYKRPKKTSKSVPNALVKHVLKTIDFTRMSTNYLLTIVKNRKIDEIV